MNTDTDTDTSADKTLPAVRIATALRKRGVKLGDCSDVKDPSRLADLIEIACLNYASHAEERRMMRRVWDA